MAEHENFTIDRSLQFYQPLNVLILDLIEINFILCCSLEYTLCNDVKYLLVKN